LKLAGVHRDPINIEEYIQANQRAT